MNLELSLAEEWDEEVTRYWREPSCAHS